MTFPATEEIRDLNQLAKREDLGPVGDDVTSRLLIPEDQIGVGTLLQKSVGIACGLLKPDAGMIRVTGTFISLAILLAQKTSLRVKNKRTHAQLYSMGFFDTAAFTLSNLGMRIEQVAIVSVLGSLYGAVTVVLSALFLRERIAVLQ